MASQDRQEQQPKRYLEREVHIPELARMSSEAEWTLMSLEEKRKAAPKAIRLFESQRAELERRVYPVYVFSGKSVLIHLRNRAFSCSNPSLNAAMSIVNGLIIDVLNGVVVLSRRWT